MPKYLLTSEYVSFDMAPNILDNMLFTVNCSDCLSAEFIGHTFLSSLRIKSAKLG